MYIYIYVYIYVDVCSYWYILSMYSHIYILWVYIDTNSIHISTSHTEIQYINVRDGIIMIYLCV